MPIERPGSFLLHFSRAAAFRACAEKSVEAMGFHHKKPEADWSLNAK